MDRPALSLLAVAALGLLVVPGPAVIHITTRSIDQGGSAGLASVLGIAAGTIVHTAAAALGVSKPPSRAHEARSSEQEPGASGANLRAGQTAHMRRSSG